MHIHLLVVGSRAPAWIEAGFEEYARRLPPEWGFNLIRIPVSKLPATRATQRIEEEGRRIMAALPRNAHLVGLHAQGRPWDTEELTARLRAWLQSGRDAALMIGGPDGLAQSCLHRADECWSLSRLTLPHALARVIVAEQLYRASTLMRGHPYHR